MDFQQFLALIESSSLATEAYMANLPLWVRIWLMILTAVLLPCFAFAWKFVEARWITVSLIYSLLCSKLLIMLTGPNLLWGLAHILFWTPVLIYLLQRLYRGKIKLKSLYGSWLLAVMICMGISLLFDFYDVYRYTQA